MDDVETIIYEQPLNELVRANLRLEHLFKQIDNCLNALDASQHTQTIVRLITDILTILDRPDLKSKLTKEFNRHIANLSRLLKAPDISQDTLKHTLKQLNNLLDHFVTTPGKIAHSLRDNEFLANVRQNLMNPGGGTSISAPGYHYWLSQPADTRQTQIETWLKEFAQIRNATELLLNVIRNTAEPKSITAEQGFYHESLDSQSPCQLIRVSLPVNLKCYPEISVGRHHMSIRFVVPSMTDRVAQTPKDIPFDLTVCVI